MYPNVHCSTLVAQMGKHLPTMWETQVRSLGWEDPLEKEMATHSSTLAWRIPCGEEPGRLQSTGSQRVGHDFTFTFTFRTWKQPRCSLTDEWIKKMWYIYTMEYYSTIKRNDFESIVVRWMNLEPVIQREMSEREKQILYINTYIWNLEK